MREMMDFQFAKQRREDILSEIATNRRAKALLATSKRRADHRSVLAWEIKRNAGRLIKRFRAVGKAGQDRRMPS